MEDHLPEDVPAPEQPQPGAAFTDATNEEESDQNSTTSPDDEEVATPGGHTNTITITKHLMGGIISGELLSITTTSSVTVRVAEKDEEENIELELLRAMYNDHAHNLYCPNCNGQITMIILCRDKVINNATTTTTTTPPPPPPPPLPLPLPLPRDKGINNAPPPPPPPLRRDKVINNAPTPPPPPRRDKVINYVPPSTPPPPLPPRTDKRINNAPTLHKDKMINNAPTSLPPPLPPQWLLTSLFRYLARFVISGTHKITGIDHTTILEILKCIVYGGLIESITSLNVVSSVTASDATTLNVLATGFAILFSGLIAFGYNLVDLKNDIHSEKKYQELLGSKKHFLFHSTLAVLSYLVFGLVAPITYGFAFRESDNRDYKIIAVAAAAFACIFILSIAKAYVGGADKLGYIKTTRYYLIMALSVSGVGYAVGNLIEMIMLKLGLFKSAQ